LGRLARRGPSAAGTIAEVMAGHEPVTPFARQVVAAGEAGYLVGRWRWLEEPRLVLAEQPIPRGGEPAPVVRAALAAPCVRGMVTWMRYPFFEIEKTADGWEVWILDARYTRLRTTGFGGARVPLSRNLQPIPGRSAPGRL
jgi:inner membrane protein